MSEFFDSENGEQHQLSNSIPYEVFGTSGFLRWKINTFQKLITIKKMIGQISFSFFRFFVNSKFFQDFALENLIKIFCVKQIFW